MSGANSLSGVVARELSGLMGTEEVELPRFRGRVWAFGIRTEVGGRRLALDRRRHLLGLVARTENPERAHPHRRPLGVVLLVLPTRDPAHCGKADVERVGFEPAKARALGFLREAGAVRYKRSDHREGHLGVVGRLSGERGPPAAVGELCEQTTLGTRDDALVHNGRGFRHEGVAESGLIIAVVAPWAATPARLTLFESMAPRRFGT